MYMLDLYNHLEFSFKIKQIKFDARRPARLCFTFYLPCSAMAQQMAGVQQGTRTLHKTNISTSATE